MSESTKEAIRIARANGHICMINTGRTKRLVGENLIKPFSKRKGKTEYKVSDLQELHRREQDYF